MVDAEGVVDQLRLDVTSCSVTSSSVSAEPVILSKAASTTGLEYLP